MFTHASVYVFYPVSIDLVPQPPPVVFSSSGSFFICSDFLRSDRGSLVFSDFESLPPGWSSLGGSWFVGSGFKGSGLQGVDNNGGPGGSSVYYWGSSVSSYVWLSISVKISRVSGSSVWMGVSLLQQASINSRLYEIDIYALGNTGYLEVWYYSGRAWTRLYRSAASFPISSYNWFILYVNYSRTQTTNYVSVTIYSNEGTVLASGSVSIGGNRFFIPSYVGVSVDNGEVRFDDFIISVIDPRYVSIEGLPQNFMIELYDDSESKVAEAYSSGGITRLNVLSDVVVGRGLGGVFKIYDSSGNACLTKVFQEPVVGSDTYLLVIHEILVTLHDSNTRAELRVLLSSYSPRLIKTPVLNVSLADTNPYYLGIVFYPGNSVIQPDLKLLIELSNTSSSTSILIDGNSIPSKPIESSFVKINPGINVTLSIEVTKENISTSEVYLELIYCTDPQLSSVCVYYPINLEV